MLVRWIIDYFSYLQEKCYLFSNNFESCLANSNFLDSQNHIILIKSSICKLIINASTFSSNWNIPVETKSTIQALLSHGLITLSKFPKILKYADRSITIMCHKNITCKTLLALKMALLSKQDVETASQLSIMKTCLSTEISKWSCILLVTLILTSSMISTSNGHFHTLIFTTSVNCDDSRQENDFNKLLCPTY